MTKHSILYTKQVGGYRIGKRTFQIFDYAEAIVEAVSTPTRSSGGFNITYEGSNALRRFRRDASVKGFNQWILTIKLNQYVEA